ncbi:uncharacterized protein LOC128883401 [Hylaeus volcanicus]|uniref:uncharacterized protein LOC128883401 n=1 Tax=Hylaeus volcanicus TaxID=313075 RepID=UPI0023B82A17|nr:uncharacterized protein LOC128883401 [Hylaeus volcanicus]
MASVWEHVISFYCYQSTMDNVSNFVAFDQMALWFISCMTQLRENFTNDKCWTFLTKCLSYLLLSLGYISRSIRHTLLSWMCTLRGRDLHRLCCSFPVIFLKKTSFHTVGFTLSDNSLMYCLPPSEKDVFYDDFQTALLSLLQYALELEGLENSLDNEREKCDLIRRIAQSSAALCNHFNHSLWIHLLMAQLILCQLTEKFSLLWSSVLESLNEFSSKVQVPLTPLSHESEELVKIFFFKKDFDQCRYFSGSILNMFISRCLIFNLKCCVQQSTHEDLNKHNFISSKVKSKGRILKVKKRRKTKIALVRQTGFFHDFEFCDTIFSSFEHAINVYDVKRTDTVTFHTWCCKVLEVVLPHTWSIHSCSVKTLFFNKTMEMLLRNISIHTRRLCLDEVAQVDGCISVLPKDDLVHLPECIVKNNFNHGGMSRVLDMFPLIILFQKVQNHEKTSDRISESVTDLYHFFVDYCFHRVIQIPQVSLQKLSLQLLVCNYLDLTPYVTLFNNVVANTQLSRTLLKFSIDQDEGIVCLEHRKTVIPFIIRLLVSKLCNNGQKHQDELAVRRKVIFRFFSQLSIEETPLIFCSILSSILCVYEHQTTQKAKSEAYKEQVLYDFFKNAKENNSFQIVTEKHGFIEKDRCQGQWSTLDGRHSIVLDPTIIHRLPMLAGILLNLVEIVNQMRLRISQVSIFLFECSLQVVNILEEHSKLLNIGQDTIFLCEDQEPNTHVWNGGTLVKNNQYCRMLLRTCFRLLTKIIKMFPEHVNAWDSSLSLYKETLQKLVQNSLLSGTLSTALIFVLSIAEDVTLFPLLTSSLSFVLPLLCDNIASPPVLAAIRKGWDTPVIVSNILKFVLRLCRGGQLSLQVPDSIKLADKKRIKEHQNHGRQKKKKCRLNTSNSDSDTSMDFEPKALTREWKNHIENNLFFGINIIKTFGSRILQSFLLVLQERQKSLHCVKKTHRYVASQISNEELDTITEILKHVSSNDSLNLNTIIHILIKIFPVSYNSHNSSFLLNRQKLIYSCIIESLLNFHREGETNESVLTLLDHVTKTCYTHFLILNDIEIRHMTAKIFVICCLVEAKCEDIKKTLEELANCIFNASKEISQEDQTKSFLVNWFPDALQKKKWVLTKKSVISRKVLTSFIVFGLSSLRQRVISLQADDDFQCILLSELIQHSVGHEGDKIKKLDLEALNQQWILTHCLYTLRTEACDSAVRMLALKFLIQSVDRVTQVVLVRKTLADSHQLTFQADSSEALAHCEKMQHEWNECHHVFRYIVNTVLHAVHCAFNSCETQTLKSFVTVFYHIIFSFHKNSTYLPFVTHVSDFFSLPEKDTKYMLNQNIIKQKLHLDLSCLINVKEEGTLGELNRLNFFKDILHVQKRRRLQALTVLTKTIKSNILSKPTIYYICTPIAFIALLQSDSISNNSVHLGLAEQGAQCLGEIAKCAEWSFCVKLVMRLIKCFRRFPNNNKLIVRSICLIIHDMERHLQSVLVENSDTQTFNSNQMMSVSSSSVLNESPSEETDVLHESCQDTGVAQCVQNKILNMQNVIETKLISAIRRLALSFSKPKNEELHDKQEPIIQYPQLIVAQVQLMKLLPEKKFNSFLPKLLETLASGLSSRNPEVRRKARTSISSTACCLGVPYLDYLFRFISQYLTKGYQVSVLIFTCSSILMEIALGGAKRGKGLLKTKCLIKPGTCDSIVPTLLPFIDQELARFCDPKRPTFLLHSFDDSVVSKRPGADEERYFKSAEILLLLCRIASVESFMETILPYVNELMLGSKYSSIILSPTAASKRKYQHMVEFLFEQIIFGMNANVSFSRENKIKIVFNFLYLYNSINNHLTMSSTKNNGKLANTKKVSQLLLSCHSSFIKRFLSNQFEKEIEKDQGATMCTQRRGKNTLFIQPGAATGHSAEQSYAYSRPIDIKTCSGIFALAGLRLYFLVIQHIDKDDELIRMMRETCSSNVSCSLKPNKESSLLNKVMPQADFVYCIKLCNKNVVRCFCGYDMRLLLFSAKILLKLIYLQCIDVDKNGAAISFVILKIFKEMGQSTTKTSLESIRTTSFICVRLMAALLTQTSSSQWFLRAVKADSKSGARTFHSVLLSQIRVALEDTRTRIPALQLFKHILLLRDKNNVLQEPENCALIYQCVDEVGIILVQSTAGVTKLINLCSSVYVDFLLNYPMAERIQKKRINFLVSNLNHHLYQSRQAVLSTLYNLVNRLSPHTLNSQFTSPLTLALLLRLTKEEHYETRFVVKAVLKKIIQTGFPKTFPVELTRIVDSALCSNNNKILSCVFMEYLQVAVTCVTTHLALQHLSIYLEPTLRVLTFFFPSWFQTTPNPILKEQSLDSQEDWKLCFTFLRFFEHFLWLHTSCLYELLKGNSSSETFQKLWVFCVTSCSTHSHVWIRIGVLRLITMVIQRTDFLKAHESSFLFSSELLTELCSITKRKNSEVITHVSPLSVLLWNYVNWSQDAQAEQLGLFCETLVCGITTLCVALFTTSYSFNDIETKKNHTCNDLIALDTEKNALKKHQLKENEPRRSCSHPKEVIETVSCCQNNESNANMTMTLSSLEEQNCPALCEKDVESQDDLCETALENETILNAAENVSESLLQCATEMEPSVDTFLKKNVSVSLEINEQHVVQVLNISKIRWTIGKLMWSIKYGTGKIQSHVVRICLSLSLLKGIVTQLPYQVFSFPSTKSIFESILEAVYICSSLLRHKNHFPLLKTFDINEVAVAAQTKYHDFPKSLTGLVANFGDATMQQMEMFMDQKNMSLIFFNSLQKIQKIVGKRRHERKVTLKRLKALDPQKAALRKIRHHQKKKNKRRRSL